MAVKPLPSHRVLQVPQFIVGVSLVAIWWPIAWLQIRPISDYYFFPLWVGFILVLDGLVTLRTGTSLLTRSRKKFVVLFVTSAPFWWIFEWMNRYLDNWHYQIPGHHSTFAFVTVASLSFSTVVPAVLEATEFLASFRVGDRLPKLPAWRLGRRGIINFEAAGWVMLVLVILFPHYAFPLAWVSLFFVIEPINAVLGQRSIIHFMEKGNWAALWNIMLGTLFTGIFWEMWNFFSMPKWTYTVPFVGFAHVFEMPLLGYSGYLPFGLEVFAMFAIVFRLVLRKPQRYAVVSTENSVSDKD